MSDVSIGNADIVDEVHPFPAPLAVWSTMRDCPGFNETAEVHTLFGH
jgi:hypothetical protein